MSTTPPTPPDFPLPADSPEDFDDKAYDCFPYVALAATNAYVNAQAAETAAAASEDNADSAADSATAAEVSRQAADAAANYKGEWASLTGALTKPAMVANDGAFWRLENNLADVTASEPAAGNSDWTFVSGTRWVSQFTASGTLPANSMCSVAATSGAADFTLGAFVANDFFVLSNSPTSTQTVRLLNASYTIRGKIGTASAGTNIIIPAGDFLPLRAVSSSVLEIV